MQLVLPCRIRQRRRFCSLSCAGKGKIRNPKGNIAAVNKWREVNGSWNKGKTYQAISVDKHWNWQGGKTKESLAARASAPYRNWRKAVFERDGRNCVLCGKDGPRLAADHIKSFSRYPELRFDVNNGRVLCHPCHKLTPNYAGKVRINMYA